MVCIATSRSDNAYLNMKFYIPLKSQREEISRKAAVNEWGLF